MASKPTSHLVEPKETHTHTVIFLHGRDSNCKEFADEFFESEIDASTALPRTFLDVFPSFKWVFPCAPILQSQRFDMEMSQWFDMWSVEDPEERSEMQQPGLKQSMELILNIIEEEETIVPRQRIFLCGISQGFATAIATYFGDMRGGFAGLIGLSSWMPFASQVRDNQGDEAFEKLQTIFGATPHSQVDRESVLKTPVFLSHSADDEIVPIKNGRDLKEIMQSYGLQVTWKRYEDGAHWINEPQGVNDMADFLSRHSNKE